MLTCTPMYFLLIIRFCTKDQIYLPTLKTQDAFGTSHVGIVCKTFEQPCGAFVCSRAF